MSGTLTSLCATLFLAARGFCVLLNTLQLDIIQYQVLLLLIHNILEYWYCVTACFFPEQPART